METKSASDVRRCPSKSELMTNVLKGYAEEIDGVLMTLLKIVLFIDCKKSLDGTAYNT